MGLENTGIEVSSDDAMLSASGGRAETVLVYVGFWRRLAAHWLDLAILLPFGAFVTRVPWRSEEGFVISHLAGLIIALLFQVFLVKRFGGSPGKIILRMRITKLDGSPVGYKEAGIRYSVFFTLATLFSVGLIVAALSMPVSEYSQLTRETRMGQLELVAPIWYQQVKFVVGLWTMSEIVVLLTNKKRRAIRDYMAGTVVVQAAAAKTGR